MSTTTVTLKINSNTNKGKQLLKILEELASDKNLVEMEKVPNKDTLEAIREAEAGYGKEFTSLEELFKDLEI